MTDEQNNRLISYNEEYLYRSIMDARQPLYTTLRRAAWDDTHEMQQLPGVTLTDQQVELLTHGSFEYTFEATIFAGEPDYRAILDGDSPGDILERDLADDITTLYNNLVKLIGVRADDMDTIDGMDDTYIQSSMDRLIAILQEELSDGLNHINNRSLKLNEIIKNINPDSVTFKEVLQFIAPYEDSTEDWLRHMSIDAARYSPVSSSVVKINKESENADSLHILDDQCEQAADDLAHLIDDTFRGVVTPLFVDNEAKDRLIKSAHKTIMSTADDMLRPAIKKVALRHISQNSDGDSDSLLAPSNDDSDRDVIDAREATDLKLLDTVLGSKSKGLDKLNADVKDQLSHIITSNMAKVARWPRLGQQEKQNILGELATPVIDNVGGLYDATLRQEFINNSAREEARSRHNSVVRYYTNMYVLPIMDDIVSSKFTKKSARKAATGKRATRKPMRAAHTAPRKKV